MHWFWDYLSTGIHCTSPVFPSSLQTSLARLIWAAITRLENRSLLLATTLLLCWILPSPKIFISSLSRTPRRLMRILSNIEDGAFCKNSQRLSAEVLNTYIPYGWRKYKRLDSFCVTYFEIKFVRNLAQLQ